MRGVAGEGTLQIGKKYWLLLLHPDEKVKKEKMHICYIFTWREILENKRCVKYYIFKTKKMYLFKKQPKQFSNYKTYLFSTIYVWLIF